MPLLRSDAHIGPTSPSFSIGGDAVELRGQMGVVDKTSKSSRRKDKDSSDPLSPPVLVIPSGVRRTDRGLRYTLLIADVRPAAR